MHTNHTRRGQTQETNDVIKNKSHSRGMLSGIFNACRCKTEENSLLNGCVEDPQLRPLGMTPNFMTTRGFTLIEILVVVLIIGILGAIALPQYQGNITECASGLTLNNGECVTCDIPNATSCSTTSYAPTACSEGYIVNGTACEPDPTYAQLQAVAAAQCPDNQTRFVCTIKNGTVSKCDTVYGTINEQGECVSNGTQAGYYYEVVYNPDGTEKQVYYCYNVSSGHCYYGAVYDYAAGTGKQRRCADNAAISKDLTCTNGYDQHGLDYTYDSHRNKTDENSCSVVNAQGVCTAYSFMWHYDRTYDGNTQTGRVESQCVSISGSTCVGNNYKNIRANKVNNTSITNVLCYNSSGGGTNILVSGTCPSGMSIKQETYNKTTGQRTYKTCTSYNSIDWANATCN